MGCDPDFPQKTEKNGKWKTTLVDVRLTLITGEGECLALRYLHDESIAELEEHKLFVHD